MKGTFMLDVAIIGCGITGAVTAYELSRYKLNVAVFESENDVSMGTTRTNGGVIHAGYDPKPGTLMAKLNIEGAQMTGDLCRDLDVPYKQTGSLVVAFSQSELQTLQVLYEQGIKNGVKHLELLDGEQTRNLEPLLSPDICGSLLAPTAAIVNPWEYARALAEVAVINGVRLYLSCGVLAIHKLQEGFELLTPKGSFITKKIINAAGLYADTVHEMAGAKEFTIQPNRGEYFVLDKSEGKAVSRVVFQCPSAEGKGVVIGPTPHGIMLIGPNAQDVPLQEAVTVTTDGLRFVAEKARKTFPCVNLTKSIRNFAGSRAIPDTGDFIIAESKTAKGFINLAGIKSPGIASAPAIGKMAVDILAGTGMKLEHKKDFNGQRQRMHFEELS
ncbi:MAG: NAD(P)/FAD-dependent oxidoreductase, partial [Eubacteriales bacterium]